jgi:hypothetical protein
MKTLIVLASLTLLEGAARAEPTPGASEVRKESKEAVEAASKFLHAKKEKFEARMKERLSQVGAKLEELKVKVPPQKLEELAQVKAQAEKRLTEAKKETGKLWENLSSAVEKSVDILETEVRHAAGWDAG